ncbi:hypothetical protein J0B03_09525 [Alkalibacter rhizosphaerae]|uniref:Ig-like domain-containing protein n=1 Tax=Alkalibacter rhizosphaerae TaxID=2815577 RepID=A0A974XE28_9FIRM|nr:hypothetical protein [Alkalibacter rhizosphaerae]QSX08036.1 hypothetical protein J0B03_09525 [Alkalibacter rhizosphaerae]
MGKWKRALSILLTGLLFTSFMGSPAGWNNSAVAADVVFDLSVGDIIVEDGTDPGTYRVLHGNPQVAVDNIPFNQQLTLAGTTGTYGVRVSSTFGTVNLKLAGLNTTAMANFGGIEILSDDDREVVIVLEDGTTNVINGNIYNHSTSSGGGLTIACEHAHEIGHVCDSSCGSLSVTRPTSYNGAAISGHNTTIIGGNITAVGGNSSPGIGRYGTVYNLQISGGNISSTGRGSYGTAGIGGGDISNAHGIYFDGGIIHAQGYRNGAGIGAGDIFYGSGGQAHDVIISGGTIRTAGGSSGQGIGGAGVCSNFQINGGSVNTTSIKIQPVNQDGANVYKTVITLSEVSSVKQVTAVEMSGADYYGLNDVFTDTVGKLYFYLPEGAAVTGITAGGVDYQGEVTTTSDNLAAATFGVPTCQIGDTIYTTLADGLAALTNGDTLKLLRNIEYNQTFAYRSSFTLDTNGFVLDVNAGGNTGLIADGYDMTLTGNGAFNIISTGIGIHAYDGGSAEVTNVVAGTTGINVTDGNSVIRVYENVEVKDSAGDPSGRAVYVEADYGNKSYITIEGDVTARYGVYAYLDGVVTIDGILDVVENYVQVFDMVKTPSDHDVSTTKTGYHTYTGLNNTVWIKAAPPEEPIMTLQPVDVETTYGNISETLEVAATVEDGVDLAYAWYESSDGSLIDGTAVLGDLEEFVIPETLQAGTYHYYCTLSVTDPATGLKSSKTSDVAEVLVNKALPDVDAPTGLTAKFGQTLKDVELPDGFSFEDSLDTSVGDAGENSFTVHYTPEDEDNYEVVAGIKVVVTVKPIALVFEGTNWSAGVEVLDLETKVNVDERNQPGVEKVRIFMGVLRIGDSAAHFDQVEEWVGQKGYSLLALFDLELMKEITYLDGRIESVPVPKEDLLDPVTIRLLLDEKLAAVSDPAIAFIDESGEVLLLEGMILEVDGKTYLEFETDHFSDYAVLEAIDMENPKTGVLGWMNWLNMTLLAFGAYLFQRNRKRHSLNI